ncbi:unnamed protein product [Colias eurytheme]|nr:unnamed protein product [Colias eurytheme]
MKARNNAAAQYDIIVLIKYYFHRSITKTLAFVKTIGIKVGATALQDCVQVLETVLVGRILSMLHIWQAPKIRHGGVETNRWKADLRSHCTLC